MNWNNAMPATSSMGWRKISEISSWAIRPGCWVMKRLCDRPRQLEATYSPDDIYIHQPEGFPPGLFMWGNTRTTLPDRGGEGPLGELLRNRDLLAIHKISDGVIPRREWNWNWVRDESLKRLVASDGLGSVALYQELMCRPGPCRSSLERQAPAAASPPQEPGLHFAKLLEMAYAASEDPRAAPPQEPAPHVPHIFDPYIGGDECLACDDGAYPGACKRVGDPEIKRRNIHLARDEEQRARMDTWTGTTLQRSPRAPTHHPRPFASWYSPTGCGGSFPVHRGGK